MKTTVPGKKLFAPAAALLVAALFGAAGCQSFSNSPQDYLASVNITGQPLPAVQAAVTNVFVGHGFTGGLSGTNQFTYRRLAGRMDEIAYGSHLFDRPLVVRVVVTARPVPPATVLVGCNAAVVEAENDPVAQEVHPIGMFGRRPYEDLLNEIKQQAGQ